MYAVAVGEPFDAINFYGPFEDFEDGVNWADYEIGMGNSWWVIKLEKPLDSSIPQE